MMPTLVEQAVAAGEIAGEIIRPGAPTPTVEAAAAALGVRPTSILKSLLFVTPDGAGILAIACGPAKIDRARLAAAAGVERVKLAPMNEVERHTGYPVGGASPVCHATPLTVIIDRRVVAQDIVYGGGGTVDSMLKITPAEIMRVTGASVADIIQGD